ncbi:MAG: PIG-L family deacetylase [Nanoarchaeota archaeon]|nr:PIG-L family deacetylase [Nanoarchaeota archaeon]
MCPFVADDEAVGMGGTIAKYVKEKDKIIKVVFSGGEKSLPHIQEQIVRKARNKETDKASLFIGIQESKNFGLKDTKLKSETQKPFVKKRVKELIMSYRPNKIYLPSALDPHPDHQAVNSTVLEVVDSMKKHYPVYAFEVWNIINETHPQVYVDISNYMDQKMEYIKMFKSQWIYMFTLYLPAFFRSVYYGRKSKYKYAERFYKLR